jgi:hypothetical protein
MLSRTLSKAGSEQITGSAKRFISPRIKSSTDSYLISLYLQGHQGARGIQEILIYIIMHRNHIILSYLRVISSTAMLPHAPVSNTLLFLVPRPFHPFSSNLPLAFGLAYTCYSLATAYCHTIARACFDQPVPQLVSLFLSEPVTR